MGEKLRVATEGESKERDTDERHEAMSLKIKAITVDGTRIKNSFYIDEK